MDAGRLRGLRSLKTLSLINPRNNNSSHDTSQVTTDDERIVASTFYVNCTDSVTCSHCVHSATKNELIATVRDISAITDNIDDALQEQQIK